jgi:glycosyltransferase involved in cell wall biosynthesis
MTAEAGSPLDLSVVIPVHNAADTLQEQLDALVASIDGATEVVVVDNRSTDASRAIAEAVAAAHPQVRIVEASERAGEGYARNTGVAAARAPRVAFCDADDVVSAGWAAAMGDALRRAQFVTGPVELDRLNPPWLAGVRGRKIYAELPRTVHGIPFAHGCNIGIRREVIERLGGFSDPAPANVGDRPSGAPEEVVRAGEAGVDINLAIRAHQAGVDLVWDDRLVVHYRHRPTTAGRWRQSVSYGRAAAHVHRAVAEPWGPRVRVRHQARRLRWLLGTSPLTVSRAHRARWLWTLGVVVGEIRGGGG